MNASITYDEIAEFIERKFMIRPKLAVVSEKILDVSYRPGLFLPAISVKFHIEGIYKDFICLSYDCGTAASLMITGVVAYLEEKIPNGVEVNTIEKRVNIYLNRFKQIEKAFEYVALNDISFDNNSAYISFAIV